MSSGDSELAASATGYGQLRVPLKLQQLLPGRHEPEAAEHSLVSDDVPPSLSMT